MVLDWLVHLHVTSKAKEARVLRRFEERLGHRLRVEESEPHATYPHTTVVRGYHPIRAASPADAVLAAMRVAQRISTWWTIIGPRPNFGDPRLWEMTGRSADGATHVVGVPYAGYTLQYDDDPETPDRTLESASA